MPGSFSGTLNEVLSVTVLSNNWIIYIRLISISLQDAPAWYEPALIRNKSLSCSKLQKQEFNPIPEERQIAVALRIPGLKFFI